VMGFSYLRKESTGSLLFGQGEWDFTADDLRRGVMRIALFTLLEISQALSVSKHKPTYRY